MLLFVLNQVNAFCVKSLQSFDATHANETQLFLDRWVSARLVFPQGVVDGVPIVQHKSNIRKVIFIGANTGPDHTHYFDGNFTICSGVLLFWAFMIEMKFLIRR